MKGIQSDFKKASIFLKQQNYGINKKKSIRAPLCSNVRELSVDGGRPIEVVHANFSRFKLWRLWKSFSLVCRACRDETIDIKHIVIWSIFMPRYSFEYFFWFWAKNSKTNPKFWKKFSISLLRSLIVEINPLMHNIKNKVHLFVWRSWYRQTELILECTFKDLSNDIWHTYQSQNLFATRKTIYLPRYTRGEA